MRREFGKFEHVCIMTTKELKSEIQRTLDKMPDVVLSEVLEHLRKLEGLSDDKVIIANRLREILEEDRKLLERLAK